MNASIRRAAEKLMDLVERELEVLGEKLDHASESESDAASERTDRYTAEIDALESLQAGLEEVLNLE